MRGRHFFAVVLLVGAGRLLGQQHSGNSQSIVLSGAPRVSAPESGNLARDIGASYYHPDALTGMACRVAIDFDSLIQQIRPSASGAAKLGDVGISVVAMRGQMAKTEIVWSGAGPVTKDQIEAGVKQMLGGFFQTYWQLAASSMAPGPGEKFEAESITDGGHILHSHGPGENLTLQVDSENIPTEGFIDATALKARFRFHFMPSPNPVAGDLRRLTAMEFAEQIGTTNMNGNISMDYQTVEGFHIPRHVTFGVGGAFSLDMEFQDCSVSRRARAGK